MYIQFKNSYCYIKKEDIVSTFNHYLSKKIYDQISNHPNNDNFLKLTYSKLKTELFATIFPDKLYII